MTREAGAEPRDEAGAMDFANGCSATRIFAGPEVTAAMPGFSFADLPATAAREVRSEFVFTKRCSRAS